MNTFIKTVIKRDRFYFRCSKATSLIKGLKRVYEKIDTFKWKTTYRFLITVSNSVALHVVVNICHVGRRHCLECSSTKITLCSMPYTMCTYFKETIVMISLFPRHSPRANLMELCLLGKLWYKVFPCGAHVRYRHLVGHCSPSEITNITFTQ